MERYVSAKPYYPVSRPQENVLTASSQGSTSTENHTPTPSNTNLQTSDQGIESSFSRLTLSQDFRPYGPVPSFVGYPATNNGVAPAQLVPLPVAWGGNQPAVYWAQYPNYYGGCNGPYGFTRAPQNINVGPGGMGFLGSGSYLSAGNHSLNMLRGNDGYSSLHDTETSSRNSNNHFPALISAQQHNSYGPRPSVYSNERQHTLKNMRGRIVSLAQHAAGIGILYSNLEEGLSEVEIDMVLVEVANSLCDLLSHQFGSFFVPRLFWACNEHQRTRMIQALTRSPHKLINSCLVSYGARAMHKMLEKVVTPQQMSLVTSALSPAASVMSIHPDAQHVIEYFVKNFPAEYNTRIFDEIADDCFRVATDLGGCRVLQSCLEMSDQEARQRLISNIIENAVDLTEDPYGNYVVQHLLGLKIKEATEDLWRKLKGNFVFFSCNMYASHVVEKFFLVAGKSCSAKIITELVESPDAEGTLLDHWGNFVIQTALKVSKGRIRDKLLLWIQNNAPTMESNMYGKRILGLLEKMGLRGA